MFVALSKVAAVMREFEKDWFVAGGWAIDLFLGRETRPHQDIEIAIFRLDQLALQKYLHNWKLKKAVGGELVEWKENEFLELPVHEIHCLNQNEQLPALEVLLNEKNESRWLFRRDRRIGRSLSKLTLTTNSGLKFLRPEIVLLYKSKDPRAKDELDFQAVADSLDLDGKDWLINALAVCYSAHHWLETLKRL